MSSRVITIGETLVIAEKMFLKSVDSVNRASDHVFDRIAMQTGMPRLLPDGSLYKLQKSYDKDSLTYDYVATDDLMNNGSPITYYVVTSDPNKVTGDDTDRRVVRKFDVMILTDGDINPANIFGMMSIFSQDMYSFRTTMLHFTEASKQGSYYEPEEVGFNNSLHKIGVDGSTEFIMQQNEEKFESIEPRMGDFIFFKRQNLWFEISSIGYEDDMIFERPHWWTIGVKPMTNNHVEVSDELGQAMFMSELDEKINSSLFDTMDISDDVKEAMENIAYIPDTDQDELQDAFMGNWFKS